MYVRVCMLEPTDTTDASRICSASARVSPVSCALVGLWCMCTCAACACVHGTCVFLACMCYDLRRACLCGQPCVQHMMPRRRELLPSVTVAVQERALSRRGRGLSSRGSESVPSRQHCKRWAMESASFRLHMSGGKMVPLKLGQSAWGDCGRVARRESSSRSRSTDKCKPQLSIGAIYHVVPA